MPRIFTKIVKSCCVCPAVKMDANKCGLICSKNGRFLGWDREDEFRIPEWCPLPSFTKFDISDMERYK